MDGPSRRGRLSTRARPSDPIALWSPMNTPPEKTRKLDPLPYLKFRGEETDRPQSSKAAPSSNSAVESKDSQPAELRTAHRTGIPATYLAVEPKPILAYDDNPVFNECGAAIIVGVSADQLKKWRQRKQGPDYIQYGQGGTVRYELNALMAFRAAYRVQLCSER